MTLLQPNAPSWTQSYGYDAGNRLQSVSSSAGTFAYAYKGCGNLVTNLALPNGAAITNAFDSVARLTGTWLKNSSGSNLNSHIYGYNLANQRTTVTNFAGNYVNYTYDNIGELKTAIGKESGGSSRLHEQFGYAYDAAGNLNNRTNNALTQTFAMNNLNALTNVTRSGTLTVAGGSTSAATNVTVNGSTASRYNDNTFALAGFTVTNGNNTFAAIASDSLGRRDTNSVSVNLPATVNYIYDLNGNLNSDGTRGFEYDDENELIRVTVTNTWKSEFTYDGRMRRRTRKDFTWQNSVWVVTNEVRYIYDGNLEIQCRNGNNLPTLAMTRGLDLSGDLQGAGGIGGLLARTDTGNGQTAYFHTDGNGNVTALINAQQIIVAKYLYDPFGNTLSKAGPLADANTYRFSSKDSHANSGLYYYGYRFYDPNLQRWLNRDPLPEKGFGQLVGKLPGLLEDAQLYAYVRNDPISRVDPLGLTIYKCSRATSGAPFNGFGRHAYLWDDRPGPLRQRSCGMESPYGCSPGKNSGPTDTGPIDLGRFSDPLFNIKHPDVLCTPIPGTQSQEDRIMRYCEKKINSKVWFFIPGKNDCQTACDRTLQALNLPSPPHPRFNPGDEEKIVDWLDRYYAGFRQNLLFN